MTLLIVKYTKRSDHFKMNRPIENTNLNINSWLINCGFMYGHLQDGKIYFTKITICKWLIGLNISIFTAIKWAIFMFSTQDSMISDLLGDWSYVYGPKLLLNLMMLFCEIYVLFAFILFFFSLKHPKKMLFWLEQMNFDNDNRCFRKLDLNESDLKSFTKRMCLLRIIYNGFVCSLILFFIISANYSVFKYKKAHYFYYLISIIVFCPQFYINLYVILGFLVNLYQVI